MARTVWWVGLLATACSSYAGEVQEASEGSCVEVATGYAEVTADPRYDELYPGERHAYEEAAAGCFLELRRPERTLEIVRRWGDDDLVGARLKARASAQLAKEDECRVALERVAKASGKAELAFWLETEEFGYLASQDWFLRLVSGVWASTHDADPYDFAEELARFSKLGLVPLRVASADTQRPPGELALWFGVVRESRIDRANGRTLLYADGVDLKEQLVRVETTTRTSDGLLPRTDRAESRFYQDAVVPNGLGFVVHYDGVSERLANLQLISAFGRHAGRDRARDVPIVQAFVVGRPDTSERMVRR